MGALLWLLLLFVGFVAALASSAKLRKNAFIWFSYVTITGCASGSNKTQGTSPSRVSEGRRDPDLVYFEPREVVERRQHAEQDGLERSGVSERSSHMSDSGSSGGSDVGSATPASASEASSTAVVKKQLTKKYGQDFEAAAIRNVDGCVNERVIQKLSVQPPSAFLVVNYMKEIAKEFKVDWEPDEAEVTDPLAPIPAPTGATVMSGAVSGPEFTALYAPVRGLWFLSISNRCHADNCCEGPPPGNTPSYLPNVPAGKLSEEAAAPAPLQASLSRRSVNAYTNQPTHYYSDTSSQPVSSLQYDDAPAQQHNRHQHPRRIRKVFLLQLPLRLLQPRRSPTEASQILTSSLHALRGFASAKTATTRITPRSLSRTAFMNMRIV
ncbi:Vacuolar protein sorting-associated protein Ist1 [Phytophthora cactorum]|nr:Vacuolar protein sorting-associated protein Ist1 [Phytophthora cactorum]